MRTKRKRPMRPPPSTQITKVRRTPAKPPSSPPSIAAEPLELIERDDPKLVDAYSTTHRVAPMTQHRAGNVTVTMYHRSQAAADAIEGRESAAPTAVVGLCSGCAFWGSDGSLHRQGMTPLGFCRAEAPQRGTENMFGESSRRWPITKSTDGCGRFTKKGRA